MPRVNIARKNRAGKKINCGKCGEEIKPRDQYKSWSFRYGGSHIRCMKAACAPRPSDLTQSKMSGYYAAREAVEDALAQVQGDEGAGREAVQKLIDEIRSQAEEVRSVGEEYQASMDNMAAQGGSVYEEMEEKADGLNECADSMDSTADDMESELEEKPGPNRTQAEHWQAVIDKADEIEWFEG